MQKIYIDKNRRLYLYIVDADGIFELEPVREISELKLPLIELVSWEFDILSYQNLLRKIDLITLQEFMERIREYEEWRKKVSKNAENKNT